MRTLLVTLAVFGSVAVQAQAPTFERGDVVQVRPSETHQTTLLQLRAVAIPNDRVRGEDSTLYVNDAPVMGFSQDYLARAVRTEAQAIPDGHYFVMGEQRVNQDISEYTGLHPAGELERVR